MKRITNVTSLLVLISLALLSCRQNSNVSTGSETFASGNPNLTIRMLTLCGDSSFDSLNETNFAAVIEKAGETLIECPADFDEEANYTSASLTEDTSSLNLLTVGPVARLAARLKILISENGKLVITLVKKNGQIATVVRNVNEIEKNPTLKKLFDRYEGNVFRLLTRYPDQSYQGTDVKFVVENVPIKASMYGQTLRLKVSKTTDTEPFDAIGFTLLVHGEDVITKQATGDAKTNMKIVLKSRTVFKDMIKGLPNGTIVNCKAVVWDELGTKRIDVYSAFGFGPPHKDSGRQFGVIKDGKIIPLDPSEIVSALRLQKTRSRN